MNAVSFRRMDEQSARKPELGRKLCPFAALRLAGDLHQHARPFVKTSTSGRVARERQKSRLRRADLDERGAHTRNDAGDAAEVNVSGKHGATVQEPVQLDRLPSCAARDPRL